MMLFNLFIEIQIKISILISYSKYKNKYIYQLDSHIHIINIIISDVPVFRLKRGIMLI